MKRYQLAIALKEKEYTRRLADFVRSSSFGEKWQVAAFTHPGACKQYAKQGYMIDLILAEPDLLRELRPELAHIPSIALVSKLGGTGEQAELLQYQPLPQLLNGMDEQFEAMSGSRRNLSIRGVEDCGAKVITVHSASGGVGKTTLSLHLANAASARELKVIYINLERWNTSDLWLPPVEEENHEEGMSELLYAIKAGSQLSQWFLRHRKYHTILKCDYLPGFRNMEDRLSLSADDAVALVDAVSLGGLYDFVVVDLDDGFEELHISLLERSYRNFWMLTDAPSVNRKFSMAIEYGAQKWGERFARISQKSELVRNCIDKGGQGRIQRKSELKYAPIVLPKVGEWNGVGDHPVLLSSTQYRAAVGSLLKHTLGEGAQVHGVR